MCNFFCGWRFSKDYFEGEECRFWWGTFDQARGFATSVYYFRRNPLWSYENFILQVSYEASEFCSPELGFCKEQNNYTRHWILVSKLSGLCWFFGRVSFSSRRVCLQDYTGAQTRHWHRHLPKSWFSQLTCWKTAEPRSKLFISWCFRCMLYGIWNSTLFTVWKVLVCEGLAKRILKDNNVDFDEAHLTGDQALQLLSTILGGVHYYQMKTLFYTFLIEPATFIPLNAKAAHKLISNLTKLDLSNFALFLQPSGSEFPNWALRSFLQAQVLT